MTDDATLLADYARNRSEEAFAELVRRHLTLVYSAALRRINGDVHRAQDVAQIVFTGLARDAAQLSRHPALTGWLYTATRNATIDLLRSERRRRQREEAAMSLDENSSADAPADWEQLRPVLDEAMDELDARDREAVLLRFFESQPFSRVATVLRVNEDAARKRVDRALDQLGALLARRGITSTGGALAALLANQTAIAAPAGVAASITTMALAGAGATVAGAGAAGLFIMSTTKAVTGISAAVALIAIGTAIYQTSASREALTAAQRERDDLRAQLTTSAARAKQVGETLASAQQELGELRAVAAKPIAPASVRSAASHYGATMDYVLEHQEAHAPFLQQQTLRMKARYERFVAAAGLSSEQQTQFLQTLERLAADEFDFMTALHAQGFGVGRMPEDPAGRARFEQMLGDKRERAQAVGGQLRTLLGDERFRQFQQFTGTIAERNVADQIAGRLYHTDAPLTAQQAERLTQVLVQNRFAPQGGPSPTSTLAGTFITPKMLSGRVGQAMQQGGMTMLDWLAPVTDAALAQAGTVLSPAQIAALQQVQAQQLTQFQLAPPPPSTDGR